MVLALVTFVDQVDTSILRGVQELIKEEFRLSDFAIGALSFAFVFVNALVTIPAGWVADRYTRTRVIGWVLLSWSALSTMAALALNYVQLFAARALLGFGQAVDDPSSTSLLADYYPARARGRVFSVQQVLFFVGLGAGVALGGFVGGALGWRWAFLLVGVPGSLTAIAVFRLREPVRGEADGVTEDLHDRPESLPPRELAWRAWAELRSELKMVLGIRTMRYILIGVSVMLFTVMAIGQWLVPYYERTFDMSTGQAAGVVGLVLGIGGIIGTLWGGRAADRVYGTSPAGRINLVSSAITACAAAFMISFAVDTLRLTLPLQFLGLVAASACAPALRAALMDVAPTQSRGMSTSAFALISTVFGTALAPPLVGLLSDLTGSLVTAFYIVMPPVIVGALILRRARFTIAEDAQAIIQSIVERNHALGTADGTGEPTAPLPTEDVDGTQA